MHLEYMPGIVIGVLVLCAIQTMIARKDWQEQDRRKAREERYERKLRDRRDNMGGRITNALKQAARENPEGSFTVEVLNSTDRYWIFVMRQEGKRRVQFLLVGVALGGTGFDVTVHDDSWNRYVGPTEFFVDEMIPRLVERTKTFGIK